MTAGAGVSEEEDGGEGRGGDARTGSRPVLAAGDGGGLTAGGSCNQLLRVIIYRLMLEIRLATVTRYGPRRSYLPSSDVPLEVPQLQL